MNQTAKKHSEKLFDTLLQISQEGVMVTDSLGYVRNANQKALEILALKESECINHHFFELFNFDQGPRKSISLNENRREQPLVITTKKARRHRLIFSMENIPQDGDFPGMTMVTFREENFLPMKKENAAANSSAPHTFESIIMASSTMKEVVRISQVAAKTSSSILIYGESGTGKELVAQSIHNASSRAFGPFIALNCGAIPQGLMESELFGYEGGTFTGARATGHAGKFELADGGTIFLDEIGDMPLNLQVILLRVLQSHEITRLGGKDPKRVDVRVIAATNASLEERIAAKAFRSDLYYRLNVFPIRLPSLRERVEDIELLCDFFIHQSGLACGRSHLTLEPATLKALKAYLWPGNIRELENAMEWSVNMAPGDTIGISDLPEHIRQAIINPEKSIGEIPAEETILSEEMEKELILAVLKNSEGNISETAKALGINRRSLYRKLDQYRIDITEIREETGRNGGAK